MEIPTGWTLFKSSTSPTFTSIQTSLNDGSPYPIVSGVTGSLAGLGSIE
jgi:hypothetical protein